ncbi:hypothetical protein PPYR_09174 [Photinus pyralis]|uniref:Uncharacterized protein n=1 Tax=Photinus pyralis TaxID=7054 RepID=A0A5N4ALI4_PHOPY|nr:uncharacterized protein LOC116172219 [Photinus pyralis]KAB0798181.1 hypothetical protein PPYR_09174 [Photinus pyralis]
MIVLVVVVLSCFFGTLEARTVPPDLVEHWKKMVLPYHTLCLNETHDNPEPIIHMLAEFTLPEEKVIHCYWKCFHEHIKFVVNGKMDVDLMVKTVYKLTPELAEKCVEQAKQEEELCQRSYVLVQCVVMNEVD